MIQQLKTTFCNALTSVQMLLKNFCKSMLRSPSLQPFTTKM